MRKRWAIGAGVAAAALAVALPVFEPWTAFTDKEVNEALPEVTASPTPTVPGPTPGVSPSPAGPVTLSTGRFVDADDVQKQYLQSVYQSGRSSPNVAEAAPFVPPIDLVLDTRHGRHGFVNGRRKWKSPGGYPTLTHGGLTVLEVAVPFIELSRKQT